MLSFTFVYPFTLRSNLNTFLLNSNFYFRAVCTFKMLPYRFEEPGIKSDTVILWDLCSWLLAHSLASRTTSCPFALISHLIAASILVNTYGRYNDLLTRIFKHFKFADELHMSYICIQIHIFMVHILSKSYICIHIHIFMVHILSLYHSV